VNAVRERDAAVLALFRARPRDRFLRGFLWVAGLCVAGAWASGELSGEGLLTARRRANLWRFLSQDLAPAPLRGGEQSWTQWSAGLLDGRGLGAALEATATTFWIAVLATVLAAAVGAALAPFAASTLTTADPYGDGARDRAAAGRPWRLVRRSVRLALVLMRSVPEYVLAFLFLSLFGPSAWPAVLALALHNGGILGRLGGETIENLESPALRQLRRGGASRGALWFTAIAPAATGSYLLYVFYRFETCVREATVLGLLGIVSLGYWVADMRARGFYDELGFLVLLGASLVLLADACSTLVRRYVRGA
jgi:phosphonate transport system permease protein